MGSNHTVSTLEERCWLQQQLGVLALCRDFGCCGLLLSFFVSKNNIQESVTRMQLHHREADPSFVKISILCSTPSLLSFMKCGFIVFFTQFSSNFLLGILQQTVFTGFYSQNSLRLWHPTNWLWTKCHTHLPIRVLSRQFRGPILVVARDVGADWTLG